MLRKKILVVSAGVVMTAFATASMANPGLTLSGSNLPANIGVTCNGTTLPQRYDIPANGTLQPNPMPWNVVYLLFGFTTTGTCNFFLDNASKAPVGTATLTLNGGITASAAEVNSYTPNAGYKVQISTTNPTSGNYYENVAGTLSKS